MNIEEWSAEVNYGRYAVKIASKALRIHQEDGRATCRDLILSTEEERNELQKTLKCLTDVISVIKKKKLNI